jgi:hypothetical protein
VIAAGCGGGDGSADDVSKVEAAVFALGTTQNVSCKELGAEEISGVESTVFTCSFDEESDQAGMMREASRCYVLRDDGSVDDVTADLRSQGSCPVTSP